MITWRIEKFYDELCKKEFSTFQELKKFIVEFLGKRFYDEGYFSDEKDRSNVCYKKAEYLLNAIIEDVHTEFTANTFFKACDYGQSEHPSMQRPCETCNYAKSCSFKLSRYPQKNPFDINILESIIDGILSEYNEGLSVYATKHAFGKNTQRSMKDNYNLLITHVCPLLYQTIYPVFLLIILDADFNKNYENKGFWELFLSPIYDRSKIEEYIFSLLARERKGKGKDEDTIFTLIKKKMTKRFQGKPEAFKKYEKEEIERRRELIHLYEKCSAESYCSLHPGITKKATNFKTVPLYPEDSKQDLFTERLQCIYFTGETKETPKAELYEAEISEAKKELENYINSINQKEIFFPDMRKKENRMYFVRVFRDILLNEKNPGNREKKVLKNNLNTLLDLIEIGWLNGINECYGPDMRLFLYFLNRLTGWVDFYLYVNSKGMRNADDWFHDSAIRPENMIAVSYCIKKYFFEYDKDLLDTVECIYNAILFNERTLLPIIGNLECNFYKKLFTELILEPENPYTGGVIDVLNHYYNLYIKDQEGYDVGQAFGRLCSPIYDDKVYSKELENRKQNKEILKDRARNLFETILERNDPSDVLNVLRTSFDDITINLS